MTTIINELLEGKETSIELEKPKRTNTDISDFEAVLKYAIDFPKVQNLRYIDNAYCILDTTPLVFDNGIIFKIVDSEVDPKTDQLIKLQIKLSYDGPIKKIREFIAEARALYEAERKNDMKGLYTLEYAGVYNPPATTNLAMRGMLMFERHAFESNKTFNNIFLENKEAIIRRLDRFINGRETYYKTHGLPHTLGFLFHGGPGTGKTSSIKAIANATQRHIIQLKLRDIKTQQQLRQLFYSEYVLVINREKNTPELVKIPLNKRFYVLEDIDCGITNERSSDYASSTMSMSTSSISTSSASSFPSPTISSIANINKQLKLLTPGSEEYQKILLGIERKDIVREAKASEASSSDGYTDSVTMGDLLAVLDGTTEQNGRLMCVTTNFPEKIDKALVRPGRIDIIVKFAEASPKIILEMLLSFYPTSHLTTSDISGIKNITPATVIQCILQSENMFDAIALMREKSS